MLVLYRYFYHSGPNVEIRRLEEEVKETKRLRKENATLKTEQSSLRAHAEELETEVHALRKQIEHMRKISRQKDGSSAVGHPRDEAKLEAATSSATDAEKAQRDASAATSTGEKGKRALSVLI